MKFMFAIVTLCHGGAQRMLAEITNGLSDRGHEVTIVMPEQGVIEYEIRSHVVRVPGLDLLAHHFPEADILVSNFYTTVQPVQEASEQGKGLHIRLALCYEPPFLDDNQSSFPSYHLTQNLLVLSDWQQDLIQLLHGVKGEIVPIGVSPFFYNMNIRSHFEGPLQITAILRRIENNFSWHREQHYLVAEMDRVLDKHPDIIINLICPPNEFAESQWLQNLRDTGKYRVLTPADDVELRYHYNHTDIFVSSGTYDAGSLPGLEAMRCGAALATVYSGGNREYGRHERNCLMSYRYENRLADDVNRLIEEEELRLRLSAAGEKASYHYVWEKSIEAFERAVQLILARSPLHR
ncbi:glycosyltransferase involved in cell wall biosynthesis [Paenibacillus shirakamiensis]|uniref:Glycosyltransferase involved in cell wall biosynthesis n=1 Tax=Paenibacillus shirakamiensis TaxID=1265935 RepID=A0ABS4JKB1_9BACL|nr:glycosyltransferase family 4 protein [Paenibacillus shirakamiensis]MBP2002144.1 glycosyltransferase involved in cell wall biosynthesis [Paenibacillus shirakamiensis]